MWRDGQGLPHADWDYRINGEPLTASPEHSYGIYTHETLNLSGKTVKTRRGFRHVKRFTEFNDLGRSCRRMLRQIYYDDELWLRRKKIRAALTCLKRSDKRLTLAILHDDSRPQIMRKFRIANEAIYRSRVAGIIEIIQSHRGSVWRNLETGQP